MPTRDDIAQLFAWQDPAAALGLLSRLPVRVVPEAAQARGARAAWAYPLAGMVVAAIACLVGQGALWAGMPAGIVAGLVIATLVIVTGALHEDGLADSADGLWGGWDKARRLEIMKDSRIGAYGVLALVLSLGLRWVALTAVIDAGSLWAVVVGTAALSRAAMVVLMAALPNARDAGLSRSVGRPTRNTAGIAVAIGLVVSGGTMPAPAVLVAALLACAGCALIARAKIGGQTGDILGATQQITEIAVLLAAVAQLSAA